MDKLAQQLREDAQRIDASISDELDRRIDASLRGVVPELEALPTLVPGRPPLFWWASSVTGVTAAIAVIAIANWRAPEQAEPPTVNVAATLSTLDLKAETAILTGPLQQELDRLQSDLKKAEEKVKRDIGL